MFLKNNTIIFKFKVIFSFTSINQIVLKLIRNLNQLFVRLHESVNFKKNCENLIEEQFFMGLNLV